MNHRVLILLALLLGMSACVHQRAAPSIAPGSYVGVSAEPLPASAVPNYMAHEFRALSKALSDYNANDWQMTQLEDGSIRLQITSAFGFNVDSAELRPSALDACAKFAQAAKAYNQTVIHIAASGRDTGQVNYRQSLADRRAAALAAYLGGQGIDGMRLRYEGVAEPRAHNLVIWIKPIIAGAEPQAWMSPS